MVLWLREWIVFPWFSFSFSWLLLEEPGLYNGESFFLMGLGTGNPPFLWVLSCGVSLTSSISSFSADIAFFDWLLYLVVFVAHVSLKKKWIRSDEWLLFGGSCRCLISGEAWKLTWMTLVSVNHCLGHCSLSKSLQGASTSQTQLWFL